MDNETEKAPTGYAEKIARSKPGLTPEDGAGKPQPAGLWRHPVSKAELITQTDPLWGDGQSRAAVRAGFEYVGPALEGSIKTIADADTSYHDQPQRGIERSEAYNKGVEARLDALEQERDSLKAQLASGSEVPGTEPVKGADATKQAAADKVAEQTGVQVDPKTGDVQGFAQLQAEAKELGLNAKGSREELTQRIAEAKAEKEGN